MNILHKPTYFAHNQHRHYLRLLVFVALILIQSSATALQVEYVAMRNMDAFKKFNNLEQSAIVIKTRDSGIPYMEHLEFASGELSNGEDHSTFFSVGPTWRFNKRIASSGLAFIEFGTSPTWISSDNFDNRALGGNLYFTSNVQLGMHFGYRREVTLSLRVHHISNGGMSSKNPGADMVGLELSYVFGK